MLVYGDQARRRDPRALIDHLRAALREMSTRPGGIERHGALVTAFVDASELAQAIADAAFEAQGQDARTPAGEAAMALLMMLARAGIASWEGGFDAVALPAEDALDRLAALDLPTAVTLKQAEGYAFYALYPQAYAAAAKTLAPAPDMKVIGLRSIGTGLAAMVASVLGAPAPITVRPTGHPFRRELKLSPPLEAEWLADGAAGFAVVDEGPGLSGSSFGMVADFLEDHGVAPGRIVFFPGHAGDLGPQASERHRARWRGAQRRVVSFDDLAIHAPDAAHRLEAWVSDLIGEPVAPLQDISGGAWRAQAFAGRTDRSEAAWPGVDTFQERRKFLMRTATGTWLLKFAGLGRQAQHKLQRAQALWRAGFTPEVAGLRHGFLVERWVEDARPLDPATADRERLVSHLGRYLGFRAARLPVADPAQPQGASLAGLLDMAQVNTGEGLGEPWAGRLDRWRPRLAALGAFVRPVETDNRLQAFEWLVAADGRLIKTDAIDHAHGHDLIGPQDIAWDVAGAVVEFDLSVRETHALTFAIAGAGGPLINADLVSFMRLAYLAFQLGAYTMSGAAHAHWPQEQARLSAMCQAYAAKLGRALDGEGR